jgi:hypothetical protein
MQEPFELDVQNLNDSNQIQHFIGLGVVNGPVDRFEE